MRLLDLLAQRQRLTIGEVSNIGIGLARALSALSYQGLGAGPLRLADVEILSDGNATFNPAHLTETDGLKRRLGNLLEGVTRALNEVAVMHKYNSRTLGVLLLQISKLVLRSDKDFRRFQVSIRQAVRQPMPLGDFAIKLYSEFPPEPVSFKGRNSHCRGYPLLDSARWKVKGAWVTPSLLVLTVAGWGLAIGLLVGA